MALQCAKKEAYFVHRHRKDPIGDNDDIHSENKRLKGKIMDIEDRLLTLEQQVATLKRLHKVVDDLAAKKEPDFGFYLCKDPVDDIRSENKRMMEKMVELSDRLLVLEHEFPLLEKLWCKEVV
ncbi:uncharacterized protein LOC130728216 [Lotus japonicus]|uniref:uncharacterized protein LOC130728216 n=1 Tax=Lotus japonicus TaxID=34305 RepID=UPI00258D672D|nr:uncharacterized protein LOC130728216 [Lotus japonicus]